MVSTLEIKVIMVDRKAITKPKGKRRKTVENIQMSSTTTLNVYNKTMGGVDLVAFFAMMIRYPFKFTKYTHHVSYFFLLITFVFSFMIVYI